jgi:hypothetical protein
VRWRSIAGVAAVAVVAVSGCGGSEAGSTGTRVSADPSPANSPREIKEAKNAVTRLVFRRNLDFNLIAAPPADHDVLVTTPRRLPAPVRAAIRHRAGAVPVKFAIHAPYVTPASTKPEPWTVQQFTLPTQPGHPRTIHLTPASRTIPVGVESGYCLSEDKPSISRLDVVETSDAVTITAYVHTPSTKTTGICAGVGVELTRTAYLNAPLGGRTLLDSSTSPPTPVNPRLGR